MQVQMMEKEGETMVFKIDIPDLPPPPPPKDTIVKTGAYMAFGTVSESTDSFSFKEKEKSDSASEEQTPSSPHVEDKEDS